LILRRATGLEFSQALQLQQLIYRFAGLAGAFLLGRACGPGGAMGGAVRLILRTGRDHRWARRAGRRIRACPAWLCGAVADARHRTGSAGAVAMGRRGGGLGDSLPSPYDGAGVGGGCDCDVVDAQARRRPVARGPADRRGHGRGVFAVEAAGRPLRAAAVSSRRSVRR
jgi:hypothetical protein